MKNKLYKYNKLAEFSNVLEHDKNDIRDSLDKVLKQYEKIVLELGCGKGEYSVSMAENESDTLFVGIDIKGDRIYKGAKYAIDNDLGNVLFIRMKIHELADVFPENSVDEIWITFPDPYPKDRHEKNRLTYNRFLDYYKTILKMNGFVHLKTDNTGLFEYSLDAVEEFGCDVIYCSRDVYKKGDPGYPLNIETYYEKKHKSLGEKIKYLKFKFLS